MTTLAGKWPVCTEPNCDHVRTAPADVPANEDVGAHPVWINTFGKATCVCHAAYRDVPTFPCDESQASS